MPALAAFDAVVLVATMGLTVVGIGLGALSAYLVFLTLMAVAAPKVRPARLQMFTPCWSDKRARRGLRRSATCGVRDLRRLLQLLPTRRAGAASTRAVQMPEQEPSYLGRSTWTKTRTPKADRRTMEARGTACVTS